MNQKVPYLSRQIVYAFLIGLIAGGVFIGLLDANAPKPLFSSASMGSDGTFYCNADPNDPCVRTGGGGGGSSSASGSATVEGSTVNSTNVPGGYYSNGGRAR